MTLLLSIALLLSVSSGDANESESADVTVSEVAVEPPYGVWDAMVRCIEMKESGGANIANRAGSGAVGVMQYMPRTFYAHAAEMGHHDWSPWVPWQAREVAAHDLAMGRRSQWTVRGC